MFVFDFFSSIPYTLLRGLAVSNSGRFVVSSSHDRSIRIWEQTDEQIFLDVCLSHVDKYLPVDCRRSAKTTLMNCSRNRYWTSVKSTLMTPPPPRQLR